MVECDITLPGALSVYGGMFVLPITVHTNRGDYNGTIPLG